MKASDFVCVIYFFWRGIGMVWGREGFFEGESGSLLPFDWDFLLFFDQKVLISSRGMIFGLFWHFLGFFSFLTFFSIQIAVTSLLGTKPAPPFTPTLNFQVLKPRPFVHESLSTPKLLQQEELHLHSPKINASSKYFYLLWVNSPETERGGIIKRPFISGRIMFGVLF